MVDVVKNGKRSLMEEEAVCEDGDFISNLCFTNEINIFSEIFIEKRFTTDKPDNTEVNLFCENANIDFKLAEFIIICRGKIGSGMSAV